MSLDGGGKEKEKEKGSGAKRCGQCKKKVGLTGFDCRCGHVFCGVHRYADQVRRCCRVQMRAQLPACVFRAYMSMGRSVESRCWRRSLAFLPNITMTRD